MKTVVIVQRRLTHYREPLFARMRELLAARDIHLRLLHGDPTPEEAGKRDGGELPWAEHLPTRYLAGGRLCWQNVAPRAAGADLVVIGQENKLLDNLLALSIARPRRLAFWGHGGNLQAARPGGLRERFKRWTTRRVDWWFAYTGLSQARVEAQGFPAARITNLENAIDTRQLQAQCESIDAGEIEALRRSLGLTAGATALYLGSLYAEKRIDLLLAAGASLSRRVPGFRLLVVGDGPLRAQLEQAAAQQPWLLWLGPRKGRDKAACMRVADVFMNPGMVGLGILDSFVAGAPMVTTDCGIHSPEIDYLASGQNGLMTADSPEAFVDGVASVLEDAVLRRHLAEGARRAAGHYTVERMAENFCRGIEQALRQ